MKYILFSILLLSSCSSSTEEKTKDQSKNKESEPEQDSGSFNKENAQELKEAIENNKGGSEIVEYNTVGPKNKNCDVALDAYIDDPSKTATNIRKTPGGEVVLQLPYGKDDYFLTIVGQKDGWFKVNSIEGIEVSYDLPEGGVWIHNSVVGASTRNYANQKITMYKLDTEKSAVVGTINIESAVHVLSVCQQWVEVELVENKKRGWIKKEWICGNPLTTCA